MNTATFFQTHRVFDLNAAARVLTPAGGRVTARERLKYHVRQGKVKKIARGLYASVPATADPAIFQPDIYLVARAARPDAVFSHHSALELLGAAHSEWRLCTAFTRRRRATLKLPKFEVRFLSPPAPLERYGGLSLGTRRVKYLDAELEVTGPERTLVEGFRQPDLVGGLEELVVSAAGFPVLDFPVLIEVLHAYGQKVLWAAAGWFLERHRSHFFIEDSDLATIEEQIPKSAQYLDRSRQGGSLVRRWRLIVPDSLLRSGELDEAQF